MSASICKISSGISKVSTENLIVLAEKTLQILKPYATEFRKLGYQYGLIPEYGKYLPNKNIAPTLSLDERAKKVAQHSFVIWLNKQPGFVEAKNKISNENLVITNELGNEIIKNHRNQFVLEDLCSLIIHYFINENIVSQTAVTKEKTQPIVIAMKKLRYEFKKSGAIHFDSESKQHLFNHLLDELLGDLKDNVYSSRKNHPNVLRQYLTKKIMQCLFRAFGVQNITRILVVDLALDLTGIFFQNSMDRSDAATEAEKILRNIIKEDDFKKQTVETILITKNMKQLIF